MLAVIVGWACLLWYFIILLVCGVGYVQMYAALCPVTPLETDPFIDIDTTALDRAQAFLKHYLMQKSPMSP